jgi:hypothetical protein
MQNYSFNQELILTTNHENAEQHLQKKQKKIQTNSKFK